MLNVRAAADWGANATSSSLGWLQHPISLAWPPCARMAPPWHVIGGMNGDNNAIAVCAKGVLNLAPTERRKLFKHLSADSERADSQALRRKSAAEQVSIKPKLVARLSIIYCLELLDRRSQPVLHRNRHSHTHVDHGLLSVASPHKSLKSEY